MKRKLAAAVFSGTVWLLSAASAQVSPMLGEVRLFAFSRCPEIWTLANGQLVSVNENQALYSLYGNRFGGDGINVFGLPDLSGRLPVHDGQGPGLTMRVLGQKFGSETTTQVPKHTHALVATSDAGTQNGTQGALLAAVDIGADGYTTGNPTILMHPDSLTPSVGNSSITNLMPTIALTYCVALDGLYPQRPQH